MIRQGLGQHTGLRQELRINPRLYQAMDLLYMPMMDLQQHLKQELLGNPFLELVEPEDEEHGPAFRVGKVSLGAVRDFKLAEHWSLGVGGLVAVNFVPGGLAPLYGGHNPVGAMGFVRLKLN